MSARRSAGELMTAAEVARLLRMRPDTFYRKRKELEAGGFPAALVAGCWDPLAIFAWRLASMRPELRAVLEAERAGRPAEEWAEELRRNAAAIAEEIARPKVA